MENDVNVQFTKLVIPLLEITECVLDLSYEDKKFRFHYPQATPITVPLTSKFINDKQTMSLTVMIIVGKKYKKIARGEINVYKKYFLGDKTAIEKWVYLKLFQTQLQNMGHNTDILKTELNTGKIFMTLELLHPVELKKKLLIKDPIQANKTERYRSVVENSNEFLKRIKQKKDNEILEDLYEDIDSPDEFDDGLSDLSISIIDLGEENRDGLDLNQFAECEYIKRLKENIEADYENILPKDISKLKQMNEVLYAKYTELSTAYNETLNALNASNEEIRKQAKEFYEKYKEIKKDVVQRRKELKNKKIDLKNEIGVNREMNKQIQKEVTNYRNELRFVKNKFNCEDPVKYNENSDIINLGKILTKLSVLGYDIFNGVNVSEEDKAKVKELMGIQENHEVSGEQKEDAAKEEGNKEEGGYHLDDAEYALGDHIIHLMEKVVNDYYGRKLIPNVKIDQINAQKYVFEFQEKRAEVELYIHESFLLCKDGTLFEDWLISNFDKAFWPNL